MKRKKSGRRFLVRGAKMTVVLAVGAAPLFLPTISSAHAADIGLAGIGLDITLPGITVSPPPAPSGILAPAPSIPSPPASTAPASGGGGAGPGKTAASLDASGSGTLTASLNGDSLLRLDTALAASARLSIASGEGAGGQGATGSPGDGSGAQPPGVGPGPQPGTPPGSAPGPQPEPVTLPTSPGEPSPAPAADHNQDAFWPGIKSKVLPNTGLELFYRLLGAAALMILASYFFVPFRKPAAKVNEQKIWNHRIRPGHRSGGRLFPK